MQKHMKWNKNRPRLRTPDKNRPESVAEIYDFPPIAFKLVGFSNIVIFTQCPPSTRIDRLGSKRRFRESGRRETIFRASGVL